MIVSYNVGKVKEIVVFLVFYEVSCVLVGDLGLFEFEEIGLIFVVNVELKVVVLVMKSGFLVLVDDLGLCVNGFGGDLGIYFVRWVGLECDFRVVMDKVYNGFF